MHRRLLRLIPLIVLLLLSMALALGLFKNRLAGGGPDMIGSRITPFRLAMLGNPKMHFTPITWKGQVTVLNVFASWCVPCAAEEPALMKLAGRVNLYGLAWKDNPEKVNEWLADHGNPYRQVGLDPRGEVTLELGMSGVPETFIIDKNGIIAWHYRQPLTEEMIDQLVVPLVDKLQSGNLK